MVSSPDLNDRDNQKASNSSRKRPSEASLETPPSPKRRKPHYPSTIPSRFWDNLSEVPLTRNALRELDRRQEQRERASHDAEQDQPRVLRLTRSTRRSLVEENYRQQSADQLLGQFSPACLKEVRRFSSHGGPDLSDLIGTNPSQKSPVTRKKSVHNSRASPYSLRSTRETTLTSARTKSTGPYDRAFQQHLIDHRVYPYGYQDLDGELQPRPENMNDISRELARPRASLSPSRFSNEDFHKFQMADINAVRETQVMSNVIPKIEGDTKDYRSVAGEIPFTNLEHLTDGTIKPGNPDLYHGARPEQLNREVRSVLNHQIVPCTQHDLPAVPNFFLQVKGPWGQPAVAYRQMCYDGALGARGIQSLQSYGETEKVYDNKAYTLTSMYQDGQLKMYTSHPIPPSTEGGQPSFSTSQVGTWALTGTPEAFRQGAAAYRNGRDWAKRQRNDAIKKANERASRAGQADDGGSQVPVSAQDVGVKLEFTSQISVSNTTADGLTGLPMPVSQDLLSFEHDVSADEPSPGLHQLNAVAGSHTADSPSLLSQEKLTQAV
ncbi:hypothetical protein BBK36DRAFT_1166787 [Trichoderma citrinoviride]|uniref:Uncharacterized protein n=1 Tax=Trichoderma citrinoviride TaxID=58853 RepID=A0A2T4BI17_9HYPO|nr:hypothetical protein BBK36DRAFT_1166787 [Trichoderma citrinoviride]PTB68911.1 hypothetical protein BBK36DRAFT_1166787 [Trichoderma citrinoviride]